MMHARMNTTSKCASLQAHEKGWDTCFKNGKMILTFSFFSTLFKLKVFFCPAEREDSDENLKFHGALTAKIYLIIVTLNFGITSPI